MSHEGIRITSEEQKKQEEQQTKPLAREAILPQKVRVKVTEGTGMEIDWSDGHKSSWSFVFLRDACPCAVCLEERKKQGRKPGEPKPKPTNPLQVFTPPAKAVGASGVGRHAIQFNWEDGHTGGIYTWDYLRRICQCPECQFARSEVGGKTN
jgi:DUF971 family protein